MTQFTAGPCSWVGSVLFSLPGYRVGGIGRDAGGHRLVVVMMLVAEAVCPGCGVVGEEARRRARQRLEGQLASVAGWWLGGARSDALC